MSRNLFRFYVAANAVGWACVIATVAMLLSGCAGQAAKLTEPRVVIREVPIPVAVPCHVDPGPDPVYADSDPALRFAADIYARVQLLMAGREQRIAREGELKAATAGCPAALPATR